MKTRWQMDKIPEGYSVVVPVYNSADTLGELCMRISGVFEEIKANYEIIMVDDGSSDDSWQKMKELQQNNSQIEIIQLNRNFGQHNALLCGIRLAWYEIIVTLDDDLQHPPEEIPKLLKKLDEGFDVVYGIPLERQHGFLRNLASSITKIALQGSMGVEIARNVVAFRVFRTQMRDAFACYHGPFVSIDVLLTWATKRFGTISVQHKTRRFGRSNYTFYKLVTHALNMMTGFSTFPLQLASVIGFSFTIFGFCILVYVLVRFLLQGTPVPGFPFLASIVSLFSGVQLFTLGIIGEYLARMHFRIMDKPPYVIREIVNKDSE